MTDEVLPALFDVPRGTALDRDAFHVFWTLYPRRVAKSGKNGAQGSFERALKRADAQTILAGLAAWKEHWSAKRTDMDFIPYPATWLNQSRWETPPPKPTASPWQAALQALRALDER